MQPHRQPATPGLKAQFLGWQCRIRLYSARRDEGRPAPGMQPVLRALKQVVGPIHVQLVKMDGDDMITQCRYMYQKTVDPRERRDNGLQLLAERYYQIPGEFSDELTAVFALDDELAAQLAGLGQAELLFEQGNQHYELNCRVRSIGAHEAGYRLTYWQTALFNATMPGAVKVLGFTPNWTLSTFREVST